MIKKSALTSLVAISCLVVSLPNVAEDNKGVEALKVTVVTLADVASQVQRLSLIHI